MWLQGIRETSWRMCCEAHDLDYFNGVDKGQADIDLLACVWGTGYWWMALIMFAGVSIFGWFFYPGRKKDPLIQIERALR